MNIYLFRHGDAEYASKDVKDFDRKLTNYGVAEIKLAIKYWKNLIFKIEYLVTSPYLRAFQSAEIIHRGLELKNELIIDKRIGCGMKSKNIIEICEELDSSNIGFVGHEPDLSQAISDFISNSGANVKVNKSMIAKISFEGKVRIGKGTLEFLIPPKAFI